MNRFICKFEHLYFMVMYTSIPLQKNVLTDSLGDQLLLKGSVYES